MVLLSSPLSSESSFRILKGMKEENKPLISLLVTVGTDTGGLQDTLRTCVEQTYTPVQIIVVDYGEGSAQTIVEAMNRETISYVAAVGAGGVSAARNSALEQASGMYVLFVDSGQQVQSLWLEKAAERFRLSNADAVQCATVYEQERRTARVHMPNDSLFGFHQRLLYDHTVPLNSMIVRRDVCSRFPEEKNHAGDWEFWIRTLKGRRVDVLPEYYGSIIFLSDQLAKEHSSDFLREKREIMVRFYPELRFSLRKVKQFLRLHVRSWS